MKFRRRPSLAGAVEAITFDELVAIGIRSGAPLSHGMPHRFKHDGWSYTLCGPDCYNCEDGRGGGFRIERTDVLVRGVDGHWRAVKRSIFEESHEVLAEGEPLISRMGGEKESNHEGHEAHEGRADGVRAAAVECAREISARAFDLQSYKLLEPELEGVIERHIAKALASKCAALMAQREMAYARLDRFYLAAIQDDGANGEELQAVLDFLAQAGRKHAYRDAEEDVPIAKAELLRMEQAELERRIKECAAELLGGGR